MAKLQAQILLREFNYNGVRIPDPAPQMSVEQVRDLLTPQFPEIATSKG
jgi:PRTRC genetic system protein C